MATFFAILIPAVAVVMIVLAFKFNKVFIFLLPAALILLLGLYDFELLVQLVRVFVRYCLIWVVIALIITVIVGRGLKKPFRILLSVSACAAVCAISVAIAGSGTYKIVSEEDLENITEAVIYRHQGGGMELGDEEIDELKVMLAGEAVKKDIMEKSKDIPLDDSVRWYCLDATIEDGETVRAAFFPRDGEPDLIRVEEDETVTYYFAANGDDLVGEWINGKIKIRGNPAKPLV